MAEFIEGAIREFALADPYLVSLIENRWYGEVLEQGSDFPAVTMQLISSMDAARAHDGHSGRELCRFQLTAWSRCALTMQRLDMAIRRRFDNAWFGNDALAQHLNTVSFGRQPGQNVYQRAIDYRISYRFNP